MADNYTALKSSQKKRYISKETFNSLDLSQIPVGSEYEVVNPIEKGDLSADINNALNKAEKSISEPTNQTTGSDGDVLVKKGGGSEWKSMPVPTVVQGTGQSTTDVMSQKATTDSLNLLEAKLNENIVKDPSKTYLVWKGNQFPNSIDGKFKAPAGSIIDWGDGVVETFTVASTAINTHTYTDGYDYHLITISGLTSIDDDVFRNCIGLTSLTIGNSVTSIGVQVFKGCNSLTSVTIGNGVTSIGGLIFADCSGLTSIMIPDSVTKIDSYLFKNCNSLTSIVIPDSVTLIDDSAFLGCYKLTSITLKSTTPPTLSSGAIPTTIEKIIVPKSAINAYKAETGWSTYADKIVYEVDSSDLPDTSKFAKLDEENTFTQKQHLPMTGMAVGTIGGNNPAAEYDYCSITGYDPTTKTAERFYLPLDMWKQMDNVLALQKDIPDTSNLSSFSVEVW